MTTSTDWIQMQTLILLRQGTDIGPSSGATTACLNRRPATCAATSRCSAGGSCG
jgi:hypothetical protein